MKFVNSDVSKQYLDEKFCEKDTRTILKTTISLKGTLHGFKEKCLKMFINYIDNKRYSTFNPPGWC